MSFLSHDPNFLTRVAKETCRLLEEDDNVKEQLLRRDKKGGQKGYFPNLISGNSVRPLAEAGMSHKEGQIKTLVLIRHGDHKQQPRCLKKKSASVLVIADNVAP
jgi:hypothetical protein